jgi:hypothetical protein
MPGIVDNLEYNGVALGIGSKRSIDITPVYTTDGRQVKHHRISIQVEALVATYVDETIEDIKAKLTRQGGQLFIENCGFGQVIDINGGFGTMTDIEGGPFPKLLRFEPMAASLDSTPVYVVWQCEANVFLPSTTEAELGNVLEFQYAANYTIDDKGWSTRHVSGRIKVRRELVGNDQIGHNADEYRNKIKVVKPEGFARHQTYDLSEDKSTLAFSITDTQIRTRQPYPPGVVEIQCTHRASRSRSQLSTTRNHISFHCEVAANQPTVYAWFVFQQIVGKRLQHTRSQGIAILIDEIEAEEEIFGTGFSASVSYHTLQDAGQGVMASAWLFNSGMFQAVQLSWDAWEKSVHEIEEARGIANLIPDPIAQDRLVNAENQGLPEVEDVFHPHFDWTTPLGNPLCNELPTPELSWKHFEAHFDLKQSALEQDQWIPLGPEVLEDGVLSLNELNGVGRNETRKEIKALLAKNNGGLAATLIFRGSAVRVGWEIPLPKLVIPGVKVSLIEKRFMPKYFGIYYCQPVYGAKWEMKYQLGDLPAGGSGGGLKSGYAADGTYIGHTPPPPSPPPSP